MYNLFTVLILLLIIPGLIMMVAADKMRLLEYESVLDDIAYLSSREAYASLERGSLSRRRISVIENVLTERVAAYLSDDVALDSLQIRGDEIRYHFSVAIKSLLSGRWHDYKYVSEVKVGFEEDI